MSRSYQTALRGLACIALTALGGLTGCAEPTGPAAAEPTRLADVVVTDPNFDFSTSQTVRLELRAAEGALPQAIEVSDAEGRRLMDGAFKAGASIDLKVPVGRSNTVKLRIGSGTHAVERELAVDSNNHAVGQL